MSIVENSVGAGRSTRRAPETQEGKITVLLNAPLSLRDLSLVSRLPVVLPGQEPLWLRRNAEHQRELKALRAEQRAERKANAVDRAERGWLARLGFARD